jgi:hypothetical protein
MHLTFIVGMIAWVLKIDQLKVHVIPFFPLALLVYDEKVHLL